MLIRRQTVRYLFRSESSEPKYCEENTICRWIEGPQHTLFAASKVVSDFTSLIFNRNFVLSRPPRSYSHEFRGSVGGCNFLFRVAVCGRRWFEMWSWVFGKLLNFEFKKCGVHLSKFRRREERIGVNYAPENVQLFASDKLMVDLYQNSSKSRNWTNFCVNKFD